MTYVAWDGKVAELFGWQQEPTGFVLPVAFHSEGIEVVRSRWGLFGSESDAESAAASTYRKTSC